MRPLNTSPKESTMVSSDAQLLTVRLDVLRDIIIEMAAALPRIP